MSVMQIYQAKSMLFKDLQSRFDGIMAAGVKEDDGRPYIIVYVNSADKLQLVPGDYMGNKVKAEVKRQIKAY